MAKASGQNKACLFKIHFLIYVVGSPKNRLNEKVL